MLMHGNQHQKSSCHHLMARNDFFLVPAVILRIIGTSWSKVLHRLALVEAHDGRFEQENHALWRTQLRT
jgi:hypothetical protein